jgi:hypothetical protein
LFDYPYGQVDDFDADGERAIEWAGFAAACSTQFGRGRAACERFRLCRVGVEADNSLVVFERKLDGAYDWVSWKEAAARHGRALRRRRDP